MSRNWGISRGITEKPLCLLVDTVLSRHQYRVPIYQCLVHILQLSPLDTNQGRALSARTMAHYYEDPHILRKYDIEKPLTLTFFYFSLESHFHYNWAGKY